MSKDKLVSAAIEHLTLKKLSNRLKKESDSAIRKARFSCMGFTFTPVDYAFGVVAFDVAEISVYHTTKKQFNLYYIPVGGFFQNR